MNRVSAIALIVLILAVFGVVPALAQDAPAGEVIAEALRNPRQLSYDAEGNLYIAEAGLAGPEATLNADPFGASAQITRIAPDGGAEVVVRGLTSYRAGDSLGAAAVQVTDESIWVLLSETSDTTIPFSHALVELDRETGRVVNFIDLLTLELEQDPDGNPNGQSNPSDFAVAPDGTIYIANAGCNCLMSWTAEAGLGVAAAWPFEGDNPVPTSVEVDANGDIYVGFLTGFPWPQGGARVERWSGGELAETFGGLTMVTGLLLAQDGTLYAVEHTTAFDPANFSYAPGRVVRVTAEGVESVLEGLNRPYGLAQAPDGTIVVSVNSVGEEAAGQVIVVPVG
jgi:hypothetical protein